MWGKRRRPDRDRGNRENVRKGETKEEAQGRSHKALQGMLRILDFILWAVKSLQRKFCCLLQNRCYALNVHVLLQFICCNSKSPCAGVWIWGPWEVTRAWSWNSHNGNKALIKRERRDLPLPFLLPPSGSLPPEDITKTKALIRNQLADNLDLGLSSLQNCEK